MEKNSAPGGTEEPAIEDRWLTSREAAAMLGVTPHTLRSYRTPSMRRGPRHFKDGRGHVFYSLSEVRAYKAGLDRLVPVEG